MCILSVGDRGDDMGGMLFIVQYISVGHFILIHLGHVQRLCHGDLLGGVGNGRDLRVAVGRVDVLGRALHLHGSSTYVQLDISFHIQGVAALILCVRSFYFKVTAVCFLYFQLAVFELLFIPELYGGYLVCGEVVKTSQGKTLSSQGRNFYRRHISRALFSLKLITDTDKSVARAGRKSDSF